MGSQFNCTSCTSEIFPFSDHIEQAAKAFECTAQTWVHVLVTDPSGGFK